MLTFRTIVLVASLGTATSLGLQAQGDALGSIAGTVVDAVTGEPLGGVEVTFCSQYTYFRDDPEGLVADRQVATAPDGRFLFSGVPAGRYHICLGGMGKYLPDYSLRFYEVRPGEAVRGVIKKKWPLGGGGIVGGRVVDEQGQSVAGARVTLISPTIWDGIPQIQRLPDVISGPDGRFIFDRVGGGGQRAVVVAPALRFVPEATLTPGTAAPRTGAVWNGFVELLNEPAARNTELVAQSRVDVLSAFPPKPADRPIEFFSLSLGQGRRDLQVQLQSAPAYRVSGQITGTDLPVKNLLLSLERADLPPTRRAMPAAECLTDGTGRFAFLRVPAGRYRIRADTAPQREGPRGASAQSYPTTVWVDAIIDVRGTVDALSIEARRGMSIRGTLRFEGPNPPSAAVRNMSLTLDNVNGRAGEVPVIAAVDGDFTSVALSAGEYVLRPGPFGTPPNWAIKSAIVDGQDITDVPLVIGAGTVPGRVVVTMAPPNPSDLSGVVHTPDGEPDAAATVLLFSPDRKYWSHNTAGNLGRTRIAMSSRLGAYLLRDVRPGEYLVVAVPDSQDVLTPLFGPDPELFERLAPRATRVTVGDGAKVVQDLRTQP